jgi:protein phosphatase 1L
MIYVIEDIGSRNYQEDRHSIEFKIYKDYDYFAIFDGHGTDAVSNFSKLFLKEIVKKLLESEQKEELVLMESLRLFNDSLPKEISMDAGTTAVLVLRRNKTYWIANVGDSRIIMNSNDTAISISEDHKPDLERERDRITNLGGFILNIMGVARVMGNLSLSRALGDFNMAPYITWIPDVYKVECDSTNKYMLLATDGLWDTVNNQEAVDITNKNANNISLACQELLITARRKGSGDNITILYISI